jgi:hypothetical protein
MGRPPQNFCGLDRRAALDLEALERAPRSPAQRCPVTLAPTSDRNRTLSASKDKRVSAREIDSLSLKDNVSIREAARLRRAATRGGEHFGERL